MRGWYAAAIVAGAIAILIAGCGGGGGDTSAATSSTTTSGLQTVVTADTIGTCLLTKGFLAKNVETLPGGTKAVGIGTADGAVLVVVPLGTASEAAQVAQTLSGQVQTTSDGKTIIVVRKGTLSDSDAQAIDDCATP